jgi:hypothetical protein
MLSIKQIALIALTSVSINLTYSLPSFSQDWNDENQVREYNINFNRNQMKQDIRAHFSDSYYLDKLNAVEKKYPTLSKKFHNDLAYAAEKNRYSDDAITKTFLAMKSVYGKQVSHDLLQYSVILQFASMNERNLIDLDYDLFFEGC